MNTIHTESCAGAAPEAECPKIIKKSNNDASPVPAPASRGWLMLFDGAGALVIVAAAGLWLCRAFTPDAPNAQAGTAAPSLPPAQAVIPENSSPARDAKPSLPSPDFVLVKKYVENTVAGR